MRDGRQGGKGEGRGDTNLIETALFCCIPGLTIEVKNIQHPADALSFPGSSQVGSMAIFDSWGVRHPVTVLQLDECDVLQVRRDPGWPRRSVLLTWRVHGADHVAKGSVLLIVHKKSGGIL